MPFTDLKNTVINNNYCCGCGLCAAVCPTKNLIITENIYGELIPSGVENCRGRCDLCQSVCPFGDGNKNEDEIGQNLFQHLEDLMRHDTMGWVHSSYVGRVADVEMLMQSPSGGMTTAVLIALMQTGKIDAAVVAQPIPNRPWFRSFIAKSPEALLDSRGSVYHMIDHSESIRQIIDGPELRYAVVGLPCVVKAIRLAQTQIPKLKRRVPYVLGLTCGGCRNRYFADLLCGLAGSNQGVIRYRSKLRAQQANDYSFSILSNRKDHRIRFRGLFGFLWLNGIGALKSCLFCDDIFAELADATFMDAWLPKYIEDPRGMNLVLSRSPILSSIIEHLFSSSICYGRSIDPSKIEESQLAVIEKKRRGLNVRCQVATRESWSPKKRYWKTEANGDNESKIEIDRLHYWDTFRNILENETKHIQSYSGIIARTLSWKICLRIFFEMRKMDIHIHNSRAVFFAQQFHPRSTIRSMLSWRPTSRKAHT